MAKLALFDLDRTLADDTHRIQYALDKEWADYFDIDRMRADPVSTEGRSAVRRAQLMGFEIGYMTGRRIDRYEVSSEWLFMGGFPNPERIIMRSFEDKLLLAEFKLRRLTEIIESGRYDAVVLFDDDREVVRLVHEAHGIAAAVHCTWLPKPEAMVNNVVG